MDARTLASNHFQFSQQIRRDLHKNPELGFQEFRTASLIAGYLKQFGYQVKEGVGKTGSCWRHGYRSAGKIPDAAV